MPKSYRVLVIWLNYLLRGALGTRRFVGMTPPFSKRQKVYDRLRRKWIKINIRDEDDWIQVEHIFLNNEFDLSATGRNPQIKQLYDRIVAGGHVPLIVDLGANIGLASRYFHELYPKADIFSVEPDKNNCALARTNLPDCATLIEAAVSSRNGQVALRDTGGNCGFQVDTSVEGDIPLVTVPDILERAGQSVPFLIKIDIEGFEEDLFSTNTDWVDRFPILLIELHDWMLPQRRVTHNFLAAMASREREFMHFDGYVVSLANF